MYINCNTPHHNSRPGTSTVSTLEHASRIIARTRCRWFLCCYGTATFSSFIGNCFRACACRASYPPRSSPASPGKTRLQTKTGGNPRRTQKRNQNKTEETYTAQRAAWHTTIQQCAGRSARLRSTVEALIGAIPAQSLLNPNQTTGDASRQRNGGCRRQVHSSALPTAIHLSYEKKP